MSTGPMGCDGVITHLASTRPRASSTPFGAEVRPLAEADAERALAFVFQKIRAGQRRENARHSLTGSLVTHGAVLPVERGAIRRSEGGKSSEEEKEKSLHAAMPYLRSDQTL